MKLITDNVNTSKSIAFKMDVGIQNIQKPLAKLVKEGKLIRVKTGTSYKYKIK